MKEIDCDVAVIGAGSAGLAAYRAAKEAGARTLLIDSGPGGTTCARVGCMPSKLLLAAAGAARDAREAPALGVGARRRPPIDGPAVMRRVRRERDHFVVGVLEEVAAIPPRDKLAGHARFEAPSRLVVDDRARIDARAVVIAVGARPAVPEALARACGDRLVTHETVFELQDLPKALAVVGAGPLGLELAVAFARLGTRVAVFDEGATLGGISDPVIQSAVQAGIAREITLHLGASVEAKRIGEGDVRVSWRGANGKTAAGAFAYVLSAAGRPPSLDTLDLNMAELDRDEGGAPKFDLATLRCGHSCVFIAGDANNARPVLHEASAQGRLAGANAARYPKLEARPPMAKLAITYTGPDIAEVGEPFEPAKAGGWVIGCSASNGRARIEAHDAGLLRLYVRREDRVIVGGCLYGPGVEHLAQMLAWLTQLEMTVEAALALPFYHPTVEEGLRACLEDARRQLGG